MLSSLHLENSATCINLPLLVDTGRVLTQSVKVLPVITKTKEIHWLPTQSLLMDHYFDISQPATLSLYLFGCVDLCFLVEKLFVAPKLFISFYELE